MQHYIHHLSTASKLGYYGLQCALLIAVYDILTTYRNEKLNVTGKIVPRYKMIKCHHRLTISLSSYAAYNQKK